MPPPGRDFIIQVSPYLSPFDPGVPGSGSGFLDSSGHLQSLCQNSSPFVLSSGLLYSGSDRVSVAPGVPFMRFAASEYVEAIDSIFAVDEAEAKMVWNNKAFADGTARFCADPTGTLYAVFLGPLPENCTATELKVKDRKFGTTKLWPTDFCPTNLRANLSSLIAGTCPSLPKPALVLPTLLGNHTFPVLPTANASISSASASTSISSANTSMSTDIASGPTGQPQPYVRPHQQIQPQGIPFPDGSPFNLSVSSNTSSSLYSTYSSLGSIFTSSASNSSTISSISSTSSSVSSTSIPSPGSFIALTTLTLSTASTSTTPASSSQDPLSRASSIISQNRLTVWCTEILGYTVPPQSTVTIVSNISATSIATTQPISDTTTTPVTVTSTVTQTSPPSEIIFMITPTTTETVVSTDEIVIEQTTTVTGPSLGAKKRDLGYMPGKPYLTEDEQPRLAVVGYNTTSAAGNTTSASSGMLPASIYFKPTYIYPIPSGNHPSLVTNHTSGVSSNATSVISNVTANYNTTASVNATSSTLKGLRTITTPIILQTFDPSIINAACSLNAPSPTGVPPATSTITTTVITTAYIIVPQFTQNTTYVVPIYTTIGNNNANVSVTLTASPFVNTSQP